MQHTVSMLHPTWPLFDLEVRTPHISMRYVDDELATQLAELAAVGVHDPATMPFMTPWTDRSLGYVEEGRRIAKRRDARDELVGYRMDRAGFEQLDTSDVRFAGLDPARAFLDID